MDDKEKDQIRRTLETYDTEKLLDIWRSEGEAEYADEAVVIVGEILTARLGELPPKELETEEDDEDDDELDEYLDPRTYNIQRAQKVASQSRAIAKSFLGLILLSVMATFVAYSQTDQWFDIRNIISIFFALLIPIGSCIVGYILLSAVGFGLDLLADIADNTRKSEKYLAKSLRHK